MASTNQSPEFITAQKKYLACKTDEERIIALEEMIRFCPKHKAGESMRANLKTRYKKLQGKIESVKKQKKTRGKVGIKKGDMQAVLIGLTNSGKSSVLSCLTNASPLIASYHFTTKQAALGTMHYEGTKVQLIDLPAIESDMFDQGLANTADLLLVVLTKIQDITKIEAFLEKAKGERLYIFNKTDTLNNTEKRKIEATLKSKKKQFILFSGKTCENLPELKEKIFLSFGKIRIYTKEPGKAYDHEPVIVPKSSTVKDVANKIFHGLAEEVRETRVTGPSSKFPNQKVGLQHILKDKDIVEFHKK
ncbi:MAG: GTPase [archaeon]